MQVLVIYDIPDDKTRNKIMNACKDYGLFHLQYSAFTGDLSTARRRELLLRFERILGKKPGNIQLFPICEKDLAIRAEIINA